MAVAEVYLKKPSTLYVSLYNQLKPEKNVPAQQYEIRLPIVSVPEESKDQGDKHHCHYHGKSQLKEDSTHTNHLQEMSFVS